MHADTQRYNDALDAADKAICDALAAHIDAGLKGSENKIWHRHPGWFLDGNPIGGHSNRKGCVRLLFWSGESFTSPGLAKEGGFKTAGARYTDVAQIDDEALMLWLTESRDVQWDYKNIVKRKGRLVRLT